MGGYYSKNTKIADKEMDYVIHESPEIVEDKNRYYWFGIMDKDLKSLQKVEDD